MSANEPSLNSNNGEGSTLSQYKAWSDTNPVNQDIMKTYAQTPKPDIPEGWASADEWRKQSEREKAKEDAAKMAAERDVAKKAAGTDVTDKPKAKPIPRGSSAKYVSAADKTTSDREAAVSANTGTVAPVQASMARTGSKDGPSPAASKPATREAALTAPQEATKGGDGTSGPAQAGSRSIPVEHAANQKGPTRQSAVSATERSVGKPDYSMSVIHKPSGLDIVSVKSRDPKEAAAMGLSTTPAADWLKEMERTGVPKGMSKALYEKNLVKAKQAAVLESKGLESGSFDYEKLVEEGKPIRRASAPSRTAAVKHSGSTPSARDAVKHPDSAEPASSDTPAPTERVQSGGLTHAPSRAEAASNSDMGEAQRPRVKSATQGRAHERREAAPIMRGSGTASSGSAGQAPIPAMPPQTSDSAVSGIATKGKGGAASTALKEESSPLANIANSGRLTGTAALTINGAPMGELSLNLRRA